MVSIYLTRFILAHKRSKKAELAIVSSLLAITTLKQMPCLYKDGAALFAKWLMQAHMRTSYP